MFFYLLVIIDLNVYLFFVLPTIIIVKISIDDGNIVIAFYINMEKKINIYIIAQYVSVRTQCWTLFLTNGLGKKLRIKHIMH